MPCFIEQAVVNRRTTDGLGIEDTIIDLQPLLIVALPLLALAFLSPSPTAIHVHQAGPAVPVILTHPL